MTDVSELPGALILSLAGMHAGESIEAIVARKILEVETAGRAFWAYASGASVDGVRQVCQAAQAQGWKPTVLFIAGETQPAGEGPAFAEFEDEDGTWRPIPKGVRTTGRKGSKAFILESLVATPGATIDFADYVFHVTPSKPAKFSIAASNICVIRGERGLKPRFRQVLARGVLAAPYAARLRL